MKGLKEISGGGMIGALFSSLFVWLFDIKGTEAAKTQFENQL